MNCSRFSSRRMRHLLKKKPENEEILSGTSAQPQFPRLDAKALLDVLPAYVTVHDREFRILQANDAFLKDFGDANGRPCFVTCKGRLGICPDCPMESTLTEGRHCSWEETLRTIHQETVHTIAHIVPIQDAKGTIVGALKISSDISQLKRLQRQLELSQQEYKTLFHCVPCYISVKDRDFRIIRTNDLFMKDFRPSIGQRCYELYKGRDSKCHRCPVEKTFEDGETHCSEERVRLVSGDEAHVISYTTPLFDHLGHISAVMEISANITEVKQLQQKLAILAQAVAVKAHAIKNILNGLKGGAYVVQSALKRGDPGLAQLGWEMVSEGVDMVSQLVKDMLSISKKRIPDYQEMDPSELAKQVWTLFHKRAMDLGIDLLVELDEHAGGKISLDPQGVHEVLSNLVSNAIDACQRDLEKGEHRIKIRVEDMGTAGVLYEIQDNGVGIPKAIQEKLFKEVISTKGREGTGLGLIVSKKIVEEHGGSIALHLAATKGTVIRVRFPRFSPTTGTVSDDKAPHPFLTCKEPSSHYQEKVAITASSKDITRCKEEQKEEQP